ncbi:MAG: glycosyltransferase, partial [Candidatus Peregrinibacteria bacterium]|nr:glycosyltransferase [Candidatus Peregrinibacteria bacterium]
PPLEAMACEVPVICSNSSSLPEVCGDAALFFDPKNTEEMAEKMDEVLNDKVRVRLIQRGKDQMQKFSWLGVAEKYFLVMNND